jgi:hypothetical protein
VLALTFLSTPGAKSIRRRCRVVRARPARAVAVHSFLGFFFRAGLRESPSNSRMVAYRLIFVIPLALAVNVGRALAQDRNHAAWEQIQTASKRIRRSAFKWSFTETRSLPNFSEAYLAQHRAEEYQRCLKDGMTASQAKAEADMEFRRLSDPRPDIWTGIKNAEFDGTTVRLARTYETHRKEADAAAPMTGKSVAYANKEDGSRFFPDTTTFGQIFRRWPGNPFGFTGGLELDPLVLGAEPLTDVFTEADIRSVSATTTILSKKIPELQGGGHTDVVLFDRRLEIPTKIEMYAGDAATRPFARYTVSATKEVRNVPVPTQVYFQQLLGNGTPTGTTEYRLNTVLLNDEAPYEDFSLLGPKGQWVTDSRLGPGKEKQYQIGGHVLSESELRRARDAVQPHANRSTLNTWLLAATAAFISLILLGLGLWVGRRNHRSP